MPPLLGWTVPRGPLAWMTGPRKPGSSGTWSALSSVGLSTPAVWLSSSRTVMVSSAILTLVR